ncbi:non-ribosomal peptide synthetase [Shumkonia mesophila]|uniref:non-ribosomal peptide synthetase n=1 Tax=Shumkonia mesophila TaxID=2838854 RepID=UPI002934862E|nr:non-ribosomal peptide synthetase [Shumkonia mesophila]
MTAAETRMPSGQEVETLLAELRALGIRLWVENGNLGFEAPAGRFSDALKDRVRRAKPRLLAHLSPSSEPLAEEESFPAFPSQETIWLARRDRPADNSYTVMAILRLETGIDSAAVGRAVAIVASRHVSLRSVFFERDGQLLQKPLAEAGPEFTVHDFSAATDPEAAIRTLGWQEFARPFDLTSGPLARFHFCRLAASGAALFMAIDHLVMDGQSLVILQRDLMAVLAAITAGREPDLPPLPASLATLATRRRESLEGPRGTMLREFWRQRIDRPEREPLPTDAPESVMAPGDGYRLVRPLGRETTAALTRLSVAGRATPTVVWVAAVAALLARYKTAGGTVTIGAPFSGRIDHDAQDQIGCFVNVLPVSSKVKHQDTFGELTTTISREMLAVMAHQDLPIDHLRRRGFAAGRNASEAFDAVAVLENGDDALFTFIEPQTMPAALKFPLVFTLSRFDNDRMVLVIEHDARRFLPARVERMAEHLERLICHAASQSDVVVGRLHLLSDKEFAQVADIFNGTHRPYPRDASLAALFRAVTARYADRAALLADGIAVTYAELDQRSDAVAAGLAARGVAAGNVVGLALDRGPAAIVATLGVLKAGAVYLPLDPGLPPRLLAQLLATTGTRRIVVDANGQDRLADLDVHLLDVDSLASETAATPIESRTGADAAYIMFTSGSTGDPKGVVVPHRAVVRLVVNADFLTLGPKDVMAQAAPMGFDAATLEIWAPLLSGAGLIFLDDEALFDPAKLAHSLAEHDVSAMWLTASLFNRVAEERPDAFLPLRQLMTGGETLSPPHVRRVMDACPDLRLVNGYGPTENTTFTTTHVIARDEADALSLPIGRPIANTRVYVLDGAGEPAPIGVWGELCAAGDGLALGYAGRDDLTGQAFATLPWREEERIYRTGDIARWRDDGVLEFAGRRDTQVKIRGHRVEIEAVEAALCRLPGVRDAAVLALGEGEARALIACIAGDATVEEEWRAALNHLLPDFMVPARFVVVPAIPVSANGKKDRRALATMVTGALRETGGRAPETDAERLVARLFAALFEDVRIDAEADFFRLGGHSLLAMRLSGLIEKETGVRPVIRDLIIARTVAGIARLIEESGERIAVLPKAAGPDFALSSGQERLWILQRLHPESAAYNVAGAFDLKGTLDVAALERALTALEERQHALRLRLIPAPGDPGGARQRLAEPGELKLEMTDVSDAVDPIADADTLMADETSRPFRLEDEAPVRMRLIGLGTSRWRLVIVLHHSICDGWSMPILLRDLAALYAREIGIAGPSLPKLSRGYEDFAEWQRAFLAGTDGRTVVEHWRAKLDPLPEPLALPTDRRRPSAKRFRGAFASFVLDTNTNEHLEAVAQAGEATPFMVLLALVQALFHRLSGQTEITLGTLAAGRERTELADLVGFFVNTLVLRQHVDPRASFTDLLKTARANCLEALANQDCPFEALVDVVGGERDTSRNPLFDVLVTWQDAAPEPLALPGVKARFVEPPFPYAKFDLAFHFHRDKGRIRTLVEYDTDLFDPESIEALWARFHRLAADALSNPAGAVGDLAVMEPEERALVVDGFNATATILATRRTIPEPFLDQVAHAGRAKAVLTDTETLSYTVFARRAATVAARLRKAGTKPGVIVALCARRSADMLAGIHGILMAGAAYAPLDPDLPGKRRADMLDDLGDPIVLAAPEHRDLFPGRRVVDLDSETPRRGKVISAADDPDALAYVIFTSGSTGRPKGVGIEHHAVLNRILWMQQAFPIGPGDVILQKTPITFDVSVWELFWWSWTGAAVALPPPGAEKNPLALVDAVDRFGVTVMHFVPSMLDVFLTFLEAGQVDLSRLRGLRYVFASGEALDVRVIERFNRLLHAPFGVQLHNLYGPTEATVDVTWQPCSPWDGGDVVPIGRPIANTRIYILDGQGQPVPIGVAGEIHIGGPQVARGYVNRPDLTAEHFIADRFVSGGRLYRTGDLGRWRRDGTVEYLGRIDHQVKVRGFRIECGEVEQALESHAAVERAVVVPAQTSGFTELHAYILGDDGLKSAALRGHLRDRLPEYMLPARFFRLESLPLTDSGKLDRKALAGQPLDNRAGPVATNPLESRLMEIWRELLPAAAFGPDDGFFDAGGNSLLVIRLHERLERLWPGVFTIADLFAHATVTAQARRVAEATGSMPVRSTVEEPVKGGRVAIVGMAVRLAGFEDLGSFWHDLENGVDRVRPLPENRRDDADALLSLLGHPTSNPFREAAYLDDIFGFDPRRFRMAPMDAALIDPEQRLFLETAAAALENAGYGGAALDRRRVGVFVGGNPSSIYREAMGRLFPDRVEQVFAQNVPSNIATRLSFLKDWRGPAATVDTACSSALVAIHLACRALANGECEAAVVGAAKALPIPPGDATRLTIDSSTARTRAFAEGADGTGMGEGAIAFLLKPLERALADGDAIHAVIVGSAVNQDGASSGFAAPNPVAQAEAIRAAAAAASISLDSLSYVEAHGTGTALGDPIEVDGLTRAFAPDTVETGFARLGSVKGNYGHLDGAAGALGLAKAVLCLQYDIAPPQPFFEAPNPKIDFAHAPVVVAKTAMPLGDRGGPRRAGVSSFGLSGINCHVILEAPSAASPSFDAQNGWFVVGLSAADNEAVQRYADALRQALDRAPPFALADVAHTLAEGRQHLRHRLAICAQSVPGLIAMLADFVTTGRGAVGEVASRHGGPMAPSPALAAGEKEAWTAAQAYLAGADLAWPESAPPARRIHLPATPFSRIRCCPDFVELAPRKAPVGLLGPAVAIRDGFAIACDVHASDFWPAAEHRLNGRPILVGMALPGMLAGAAHAIGLVGAVDVRDLRWLRPLCPDELIPGSVSLELRKAAPSGWHAVLAGRSISGNGDPWTVFAEADLNPSDTVLPRCNLTDLRARCVQAISLPPFVPEEGPVTVTARWDCRVNLWSAPGGAEKMALLRVPVAYADDLTRFPLHPALLDVAASLILDERGRVPVGCASLTITGNPLPTEVLVHAVRRTDGGDMLEADIFLVDPADGRLCLAFRGLQFVTAGIGRQPSLSIPTWISTPLAAAAPARPLVLAGTGPLAEQLDTDLKACGLLAARAASAADILALVTGDDDGVVLVPDTESDPFGWTADILRGLMAGARSRLRVLVVGQGAYVRGGDGPASPDAALAVGLTLAACHEEPLLALRYLDVDAAVPTEAVAAEFAAFDQPGNDLPIAMRRGTLRLERSIGAAPESGDARWPSTGCCVVTGGLGGLALSLATEMAADGTVSLALLGRSGTVTGEDDEARRRREKLAALEGSGIRIRAFACDITDRAALAACLDEVRAAMGPITAVVHAAGVADGGFLVNRSASELAAVLAPKVEGARNLDILTRGDPVESFVVFGSLTGLAGAPGQSAYAAANAWLDAFAAWRLAEGRPALAIDWCALSGVGMAVRHNSGAAPGTTVTPTQAIAVWRQALATDVPQIVVIDPRLLTSLPREENRSPEATRPADTGSTDTLELALAGIWGKVLGYEVVRPDDDFYALGGDSITGMQIIDHIVRNLGHAVTLSDLFAAGSVAGLAATLRGKAVPVAAGIVAAPQRSGYPVGWEQLSVLHSETAAEMGTAFNLPTLFELPADIDVARLESALTALIARHEILRTRFVRDDDEWTMEVLAPTPVHLPVVDLSATEDPVAACRNRVTRFNLADRPPVRLELLVVGGGRRALFLDIHHGLADGFTLELLAGDLATLYAGKTKEPPALQLKDYTWWSREGAGRAARESARDYWQARFQGSLPMLDLPADHRRPTVNTWRGDTVSFVLEPRTVQVLRAFAQGHGATPFSVVLAAWIALFHRLAGTSDVVVAIPADNRDAPQLRNMAGMMVGLLPLRAEVRGDEPFGRLLERVHANHAEAMRHRAYGLGQLLEDLAPPAAPDRTLLSEVSLSYMNFAEAEVGNLGFPMYSLPRASCKNDLSIFMRDLPNRILVSLEYYADLFDRSRIERLGRSFAALLAGLATASPKTTIADLPILDAEEAARIRGFERGAEPPLPAGQ